MQVQRDTISVQTDECQQKYGSATVWKTCCGVFDFLNLAAVSISLYIRLGFLFLVPQIIDGTTLCVHGGLSPDIRTLDSIRTLSRAQEIPHEGAFCGENPWQFVIIRLNNLSRSNVVRSG